MSDVFFFRFRTQQQQTTKIMTTAKTTKDGTPMITYSHIPVPFWKEPTRPSHRFPTKFSKQMQVPFERRQSLACLEEPSTAQRQSHSLHFAPYFLSGHLSSHLSPNQPGLHSHSPLAGLHPASPAILHLHSNLHPSP